VVQQEIRALQGDQNLLRAGSEGDSASVSAEREAAIRSRQQRIDDLQNGAMPRALQSPRSAAGMRVNLTQEQIRDIFDFYANFGRTQAQTFQDTIDSFMFMKMVKECPGLLDESVNRTEVDLIFTKAKPKFERRLDFSHFLDALAAIAERKFPDYMPADALRMLIVEHLAPLYDHYLRELQKTGETEKPLSGVFKKLHDVRSYTGVYAERFRSADGRINGEADNRPGRVFTGSNNLRSDETIHDISVLMRPNLRSGGTMMAPANHTLMRKTPGSPRSKSPTTLAHHLASATPGSAARARSASRPRSAAGSVYGGSGSSFLGGGGGGGGGDAGSRAFASPIRAAGGPAPQPTPIGGGAGAGSSSPVNQHALEAALERARRGDSSDLISLAQQLTGGSSGGSFVGGRGGSSSSAASQVGGSGASPFSRRDGGGGSVAGGMGGGGGGSGGGAGGEPLPGLGRMLSQEEIRDIFDFYANFGRSQVQTFQDTVDSFMFMKMVKECPGLLDESVNKTEVDLIFTKAKPKFERRLQFSHFLDALAAIAERKFPAYSPADGLRLLITNHLSPLLEQVRAECTKTGETEFPLSGVFKKLYDPRSYTGVYAERFRSADGRINGEADNRPGRVFSGSTNTGTNETIHDISILMRPNLRGGSMMTQHMHANSQG
jgi:hypothetical protein